MPLIFCYGLVCSSLHWTYQIDYFRQRYKCIWFDYRGHQNSDTPTDLSTLTLDAFSQDLKILMDELNVPDAVILGHSMGVNVVLEFLRQNPTRVKGMVLANGTAKKPLENLFGSNVFQGVFELLRRIDKLSPKALDLIWNLQKKNPLRNTIVGLGGFNTYLTPPEDIAHYVDTVMEMDPKILLNLIENYDNYDATAWLHTIQQPALIFSGENDRMIPLDQQELLKQLIPRSELEIIRHGSHCPQMDLPELVNHRIEKFLADIHYVEEGTKIQSAQGNLQSTQSGIS